MSVRTIGIIGGGQLGRMLSMAAARLGIRTVILEPQVDCPAAQVANAQIVAAYDDAAALDALAGQCDVVTYEFENVPVAAAERLVQSVRVFPPPKALEVSQDRLVEKRFINDCGVATAPFEAIDSQADLEAALDAFGGIGVLKTRRLGYDGKGQRMFRSPAENREGVFEALGSVPLILEGLVAFEREISIIAARAQDGTIVCYDPAENLHRDGILYTSTVPAAINGRPPTRRAALRARSSTGSTMSASSASNSSCSAMVRSWPTRWRRACTIPATGRRRPASSRSSSSMCARSPAFRWATGAVIRTA